MGRLFVILFLLASILSGFAPGQQTKEPLSRSPVPPEVRKLSQYQPRTLAIRVEPGQGEALSWIELLAHDFVPIPRMAASVVAEKNDTNLAIAFSAEAYVYGPPGTRMFVRALIDGQVAEPADVVLTQDGFRETRTFTFTANVGPGIHTVQMEWRVDDLGPQVLGYMRGASLELRTGKDDDQQKGTLTFMTAPSGPQESTRFTTWDPVPDMTIPFYAPMGCSLSASFSAEAGVSADGEIFKLRAVVDPGQMDEVELDPGEVIFDRTYWFESRTMVFGAKAVQPGWHNLSIEWAAGAQGDTAYVGDRTVVISCYPLNDSFGQHFVAPPPGPVVVTNSSVYETIPGLSKDIHVPVNAELSVKVSAEVMSLGTADHRLRLKVGDDVVDEESVTFFDKLNLQAVQSFTFDRKHVLAGAPAGAQRTVSVEWATSGPGAAVMDDRTMTILVEPEDIPDLAEPPPFAPDALGSTVEPAIGSRKLLTIFWDPARPEFPPGDKQLILSYLFGPYPSVADYYQHVSQGRFTIEDAGAVGYYPSVFPAEHYFGDHPQCGEMGSDGYKSGHNHKWAEAIQSADADVDFAAFDADEDGILQNDELVVLMVIPEDTGFGTWRTLSPYCDDSPVTADGVIIPEITEWYVTDPGTDKQYSNMFHELTHAFFHIDDMYVNTTVGGTYPDGDTYTEPGRLSIMGDQWYTSTYLDPIHRLALGWVTPFWIEENGTYELSMVVTGGEVAILPRKKGGDGREYYLLERRRSMATDQGLYDVGHGVDGIVIWHVVENPLLSLFAPNCMNQQEWEGKTNNNARRGIRVLRPTVAFTSNSESGWSLEEGYDLFSNGLVCPGEGVPRNALLWVGGTPSGYAITNFSTHGVQGIPMTFDVQVP